VIVADSSAVAELLLVGERAESVRQALSTHTELHVPEHFHTEVLSVLRRFSLRRQLTDLRAAESLAALADLRALTYPVLGLLGPIWGLKENLSVYDAAYLALAQRLDVGLITLDGGLAAAAAADGRLVSVDI
jgi:predicted nucleic acid-binding protein